jgi:allophanate hydrolase subunit 1
MNNNTREKEISIELNEKIAQGIYSNLVIITHSNSEFVIDFVSMMPGMPKAPIVSRIILTPEHAKRLMHALNENIVKYESSVGKINTDGGQGITIPMNFGGSTAQA